LLALSTVHVKISNKTSPLCPAPCNPPSCVCDTKHRNSQSNWEPLLGSALHTLGSARAPGSGAAAGSPGKHFPLTAEALGRQMESHAWPREQNVFIKSCHLVLLCRGAANWHLHICKNLAQAKEFLIIFLKQN